MPGMTNLGFASAPRFGALSNVSSPSQAIVSTANSFPKPMVVQANPPLAPIGTPRGAGHHVNHSLGAINSDDWNPSEIVKSYHYDIENIMTDMISQYRALTHEVYKLQDELQREKTRSRSIFAPQVDPSFLADHEKLKAEITRDPFVLVLIDGNHAVFHKDYLQAGETGGEVAASALMSSVQNYISSQRPEVPSDFKVIIRIYVNIKELGESCLRAGYVSSPSVIEHFFRSFTAAEPLFDVIDVAEVGCDHKQTSLKISELFKLHFYDPRCRHIVLGSSYNTGFARLLQKYMYDTKITGRVTLLEAVPFEKALLKDLPYRCETFGSIFLTERISPASSAPIISGSSHRRASRTPSESFSLVSSHENVYSKATNVDTWASRAAAAAATVPSPPKTPAVPAAVPRPLNKATIPRNKKGQRIDAPLKYDKAEVEAIRKLKLCNVHYLRPECPYGDNCSHRHDKKLTPRELENLRVVTQVVCCHHGSSCEDPRCIYGHRCQVPKRMDKSASSYDGGKTCMLGLECAYPAELHDIDLTVVRMLKV